MAHLALTATTLVALAFHATLWAADLLITSCINNDPLIMSAAAGTYSCAVTAAAYALSIIILLTGAAIFFVAVLHLHLALSRPEGLTAVRKGATTALVVLFALSLLCVLLQF